jgi:hypothetical protein
MKHQIQCVGAKGILGPAVSCEKPSSSFSTATIEPPFISSAIFLFVEFGSLFKRRSIEISGRNDKEKIQNI